MVEELKNTSPSGSTFRGFLAWVVGFGTCVVIAMATAAFGPSGFGFGVVIATIAFGLMVKRYRFSLRTFFVFTTVLGVWLGLKISRDRKIERAIANLTNAGGQLTIQDRAPDFPWGIWSARYDLSFYRLGKPLVGGQLADLDAFGAWSFRNLYLNSTGITDDDLKFITPLTNVWILSVANDTYSNGQPIPGRPHNQITDAGVKQLRGLRNLAGIDLNGTGVTDECVQYLCEMQKLHWINIDGTQVTGVGMARLGGLKELCMIELNGCPISADGVKELGQLTNLISIGLRNTKLTDADLDVLNTLPKIGILRLGGNKISEQAVKRFSDRHPRCTIER
jgi:hypothetical protein